MNNQTLFEPPTNGLAVSNGGNYIPQHEERSLAHSPGQSMIEIIGRVASDPTVDAIKMEKLLEMQERLMGIEAEKAFNASLALMQPELPAVQKRGRAAFDTKNGGRTEYSFAKYEDIVIAIKPMMSAHGFALSFQCKGNRYTGTLAHKYGHCVTAELELPLDTSGSKNNIQAIGSTLSYAKRYLVGMLLNIATVDEDDDGHGYGTISNEQISELELALIDTGANRGKFLKFMAVDEISLIPATDFTKAKTALKSYATGTPVNLNLKKKH